MNKIGLAVVTYNRVEYLQQCIESLELNNWGGATSKFVIDDGSKQDVLDYLDTLPDDVIVIKKDSNKGVGDSKNAAFKLMMLDKCEHLFVMEDDIVMKNDKTCLFYIEYAKRYGLHHLNYALHGPLNIERGWLNDRGVKVYPDCVGAFSYYTRECIERVGYMDKVFKNAWEHVEHTYRIAQEGLTTPFWEFADCIMNKKLLAEIPGSLENSSIRRTDEWTEQMEDGREYFIKKHGELPRPK